MLACSNSHAQFTAVKGSPVVTDGLNSSGAAWTDYDNDGDLDLFVVTTVSLRGPVNTNPLLYKNNGDGTFSKVVVGDLVSENGFGRNATWGDYNNDGLPDVFIADQSETKLYKNNGGGNFTKTLGLPTTPLDFTGIDNSGAAWSDYDADGDLDLFLSAVSVVPGTVVANNHDILYDNNGDGTFVINNAIKVDTVGASISQSWIDYNNDGWQDLLVVNYYGKSLLFKNNGGGTFTSVSNALTTSVILAVGASWADYDNDGDFDVLIQSNANGPSILFENLLCDGTFSQTQNSGIGIIASSAAWGDFDNDGLIDIIMVGDGISGPTRLFKNNGDKTFSNVSTSMNINNFGYSLAVAAGDYDKDGFLDFFIANTDDSEFSPNDILYHNTPNGNGWIILNLKGTNTNRSAIGANARIKSGNSWQLRTVQSITGSGAENSLQVHFGIGQAQKIDSIIVEWPGQGFQVLVDQQKNKYIDITEMNFPKAPSNLVNLCGSGSTTLNWNDNSTNESGFRIEVASCSTGPFSPFLQLPQNTSTVSVNLPYDGVNYFRVTATTAGGWSAYSNVEAVSNIAPVGKTAEACGQAILNATSDDATYSWDDGTTDPTRAVDNSGIYWVDRTIQQCHVRDTFRVTIDVPFTHQLSGKVSPCPNQPDTLSIITTAKNIVWFDNTTGNTSVVHSNGNYYVSLSTGACQERDSIAVHYVSFPDFNLPADTTLCAPSQLAVTADTGDGGLLWSTGSKTKATDIPASGIYWLQFFEASCTRTDSIEVTLSPCEFEMPNVFTPNGDGVNERFVPIHHEGVAKFELKIVNRWGSQIFRTIDLSGWDGGNSPSGVYYWQASWEFINGKNDKATSWVQLMR